MTPPEERPDDVNVALLDGLLAMGAIERRYAQHQWPGCDWMLTCSCPDPPYSYVVTPAYRDALEARRAT